MAGVKRVLAIDPGSEQSAWLVFEDGHVVQPSFGILPNDELLAWLRKGALTGTTFDDLRNPDVVVIEKIESYGMAVGVEVFETVRWSGRFEEAANASIPVEYLPRRAVKVALCGSSKAKDPNIRQALLDRFGGSRAQGTKKAPGPLYGISKDVWSALAIAVTYSELAR